MQTSRFSIGHTPFDRISQRDALAAIAQLVQGASGGYVVTPNVDHVVLASRNASFRTAQQRANLSLADGQPLVWIARALGIPDLERVSGSDLFDPLMAQAAARGWRVFFFGSTADTAREAERRLCARHPSLQIVGCDHSWWWPDDPTPPEDSTVVAAVRRARADLVVLAMGAPRQELWMVRHAAALGPAVAIGLGAALDFTAGAVPRAPAWMSRAGLEWLYRLAHEPRRLAYRYLVRDALIVPIVVAQWLRRLGAGARAVDDRADGARVPVKEVA